MQHNRKTRRAADKYFADLIKEGWGQWEEIPKIRWHQSIARTNSRFPTVEQRDDGAIYGLPPGLDSVPISVPTGNPGRIRSRYLYGRSVIPACAAVAFRRIKFLEEWYQYAL